MSEIIPKRVEDSIVETVHLVRPTHLNSAGRLFGGVLMQWIDEAAGIVKFKRRKNTAQKKLEDEKQNILRINDILAELEKQGEEFFRFLGIHSLAEARALPAVFLRDKMEEFGLFWSVVADGKFQQRTSWQTALRGELPDIPMLIGDTDNEFFAVPQAKTEEELREMAQKYLGGDADQFLALIHADQGLEKAVKNATVGEIEMAIRALCRCREKAGAKSPCYIYTFGPEIPGWDHPGAFHSSDLWFFFETLAKCWRPFTGKHYDLARQMCNYLAAFIKTGDPNCQDADGSEQARWIPWSDAAPSRMTFHEMPEQKACPAGEVMEFLVSR